MKNNGRTLATLTLALGTTSLFSQALEKKTPSPPPLPQAIDAQALSARRAAVLSRVTNRAANNSGLAQGAPSAQSGSTSGGQSSATTRAGIQSVSTPVVSTTPEIGLAPGIKTSPPVGIATSPAAAPAGK